MDTKQKKGSEIAKNGFKTESRVIDTFNNWQNEKNAQDWLRAMNYNLDEIEYVKAYPVKGCFKTDIQVQVGVVVQIKLEHLEDIQNIQVKFMSVRAYHSCHYPFPFSRSCGWEGFVF